MKARAVMSYCSSFLYTMFTTAGIRVRIIFEPVARASMSPGEWALDDAQDSCASAMQRTRAEVEKRVQILDSCFQVRIQVVPVYVLHWAGRKWCHSAHDELLFLKYYAEF